MKTSTIAMMAALLSLTASVQAETEQEKVIGRIASSNFPVVGEIRPEAAGKNQPASSPSSTGQQIEQKQQRIRERLHGSVTATSLPMN